ncbi:MAG: replication-associated recombination protein A [bacterium]
MDSLFTDPNEQKRLTPLAERMRPRSLDEVVGQPELVKTLKGLQQQAALPSIILWGPPGCGKTTIARLLAAEKYEFLPFSAVVVGVKEIREQVEHALRRRRLENRGTLLFLDEIHRFNKAQQDVLLPHVEAGTLVLVGATTENPSFEVNSALLSRARVLTLRGLEPDELRELLLRALTDADRGLSRNAADIDDAVLDGISQFAAGDARFALNSLEICDNLSRRTEGQEQRSEPLRIDMAILEEAVAGRALHYDKGGEEHYNIISALHKAVRGSDPDAALYWTARMLESGEDPKYVVRRMVRMASEDIGLADPWALVHAIAAKDAVEFLGMPECNNAVAQLAIYLASAPKSNGVYKSYAAAREVVNLHGALPVPLHIRNAPTKLMKEMDYGKGYKYAQEYKGGFVPDNYWPERLADEPPQLLKLKGRGMEKGILERLKHWWGERFGAERGAYEDEQ